MSSVPAANRVAKQFTPATTSLPFGQTIAYESISGPTYVTPQTLTQQVAYALSDKIFSYSPETFDLDVAIKQWTEDQVKNANGDITALQSMQTRSGAGSIALGYVFSKDFDLAKRHIPQTLLASAGSLQHLRAVLDQLSLLYAVSNPFVAHISSVDYAPAAARSLVTDYASTLAIAEELGLGLVASASGYEAQHMSLLATLMSSVLPTIHTYDGVRVARETLRVIDVLDQSGLKNAYDNVLKQTAEISKRDSELRIAKLLQAFNEELGTAYEFFEYHGASDAEAVLVVFGSVEASIASQVAAKLSQQGAKVGVINVRVYRPFSEEAFLRALPESVRTVAVLGQVLDQSAVGDVSVHSALYSDVLAAVTFSSKFTTSPAVVDVKYAREETFTPASVAAILTEFAPKPAHTSSVELLDETVQQYTFWDVDSSTAVAAPIALGKLLSADSSKNVYLDQEHDNLVQGGATRTDIRSSAKSIDAPFPIEHSAITYVGDVKLFKEVDIVRSSAGRVLVKIPGAKLEEIEKQFSPEVRVTLAKSKVELFVLDPTLSQSVEADATAEDLLVQAAFLELARPELVTKLSALVSEEVLKQLVEDVKVAVKSIEIPQSWAEAEADASTASLPGNFSANSFVGYNTEESVSEPALRNWETAAKAFAFKEAYGTENVLRPDLTVKTYTITVKENRRLTPLTYDRNIFHIEFDLGNSGLKYDIGEALGIHAENDPAQVEQFINFYGLNADDIVEVPSREDANVLETRTVFQSLVQNLDIFGKPPKRFYEALSEFATDNTEKAKLAALGGTEGAEEFKKRTDVDTVTYADILQEFQSAHPSFYDLARIVSPMKRREYSIASSQKVGPSTVALMIVVVNWVDSKGRTRLGQATRYLSGLRPGATVTASVKPSVMKLPVKDSAPLIMAGLGTGLAPFRAFVQYRAMQKAQGIDIGKILLYMGSRHQREEYLYGEEWEAYQDAGVITLLGRAFSRDQPQKIYIQDRMRESLADIAEAYIKEEGSFYLCGPTWPVPDVTAVLEEAIQHHAKAGGKKVDSRKEIEKLKEELRYVLEVY